MKSLIFAFSLVLSAQANAEWCPQVDGKNPAAVVDLGEYKFFYFVPGDIYSEDGQTAVVKITNKDGVFATDSAFGDSDYYSSTQYNGAKSSFSCDSITLDFEYAWFVDENGKRQDFRTGQVRTQDSKSQPLICNSDR